MQSRQANDKTAQMSKYGEGNKSLTFQKLSKPNLFSSIFSRFKALFYSRMAMQLKSLFTTFIGCRQRVAFTPLATYPLKTFYHTTSGNFLNKFLIHRTEIKAFSRRFKIFILSRTKFCRLSSFFMLLKSLEKLFQYQSTSLPLIIDNSQYQSTASTASTASTSQYSQYSQYQCTSLTLIIDNSQVLNSNY